MTTHRNHTNKYQLVKKSMPNISWFNVGGPNKRLSQTHAIRARQFDQIVYC